MGFHNKVYYGKIKAVIFMRILVIGSGSSGNSTYIECRSANIMIDAGFSNKYINKKLEEYGVYDYVVDGLFITHEHGDHTQGLSSVVKNKKVKYNISQKSFFALSPKYYNDIKDSPHEFIEPFDKVKINDVTITIIPLSHDSVECFGLIIEEDDKKIVYIADTGYVSEDYRDMLSNANCYLFEANHDPLMQMASNRTQELKNRVLGDRGHLSNEDSAVALSYLIGEKTTNILFIHRSRECNNLDILKETIFGVFEAFSIDVNKLEFDYAEQNYPSRFIEV